MQSRRDNTGKPEPDVRLRMGTRRRGGRGGGPEKNLDKINELPRLRVNRSPAEPQSWLTRSGTREFPIGFECSAIAWMYSPDSRALKRARKGVVRNANANL